MDHTEGHWTRETLRLWMRDYYPKREVYVMNDAYGWYHQEIGLASFRPCGTSWDAVAAQLGAPDQPESSNPSASV